MEQSSGIVKNAISTDKKLTYLKANNLVKIVKSKLSTVEEKVSDVKISLAKTNMKMVTQQAAINNVKNKLQKTNNKLTIVNTNLLKNQAKLENTEVSIATLAAKIANAKVKISRNKSVLLDFS
jgi:chromosome segregation ATPase